jgi:O-antigen/teichoic acid export membrane protein
MFGAFSILSGYYFVQGDMVLGISYLVLGIFIPASIAFNTYGSYLEGKQEFKALNFYRTLSALIYTLGTLAILLLGGDVVALILTYAITTFGSALFIYWHTLRKFPQSTIKYARELTYIKFIDPIASQIDKVILAHFWGPAQLATYSLATAIPNRAILMMKSWINIGFPKFATKTSLELNTVFYKRIMQGMLIGLIATLVYVILAPFLFKYVLPQYIDGIFYSQLLAITFIFALPNRYISLILSSQRMSRTLLVRSFINSSLNIVLYAALGITGGVLGLVIASILSSVINLFMNIALWRTYAPNVVEKPENML